MGARTALQNIVSSKTFGGLLPPVNVTTPWVRNPSWRTFSAPTSSEQKFVGLHLVWPDSNFCALVAAGDYTVDWGDGVIDNVTANTVAYHQYDFADADLANTNAPVTFTDSTDLVTRNNHGYSNGTSVQFYNIVSTTGITEGQTYFVINATTNTFQISETVNGAAIALTTDGSATLLPYKQAIVTVTPQAGQNLTYLNLHQKHNQTGLQAYCSGFVDIAISGPSLTDLRIGVSVPSSTTQTINFYGLEQVNIVRSDCKQLTNLFQGSTSLKSVINLSTSLSSAQTLNVSFTDAGDLVNCTGHGFRNGDSVVFTNISTTTGITALTQYYIVNATADTFQVSASYGGSAVALTNNGTGTAVQGTTLRSCFSGCSALEEIMSFDTENVISTSSMFSSCFSLRTVPLFDTSAVVDMSEMFSNCVSLLSIPLFNTVSVLSMSGTFRSCTSLTSIPLLNTAAVTNMSSMFANGFSDVMSCLKEIPLLNTASVTNMSSMFAYCRSLRTVPLLNTASVTNMSSMFYACIGLTEVPLFNTASVTNMSNMFTGCASLIAVPLFNTASVTNMSSMFNICRRLKIVPLFNTSSVTNMSSMFANCNSLTSVPALNVSSVTNSSGYSSMFNSCSNLTKIQAKDFKFTFSVTGCKLSSSALNEIYTNLPTVTGQTITVSNNWGTSGDDPTIATAKGWTVTG